LARKSSLEKHNKDSLPAALTPARGVACTTLASLASSMMQPNPSDKMELDTEHTSSLLAASSSPLLNSLMLISNYLDKIETDSSPPQATVISPPSNPSQLPSSDPPKAANPHAASTTQASALTPQSPPCASKLAVASPQSTPPHHNKSLVTRKNKIYFSLQVTPPPFPQTRRRPLLSNWKLTIKTSLK